MNARTINRASSLGMLAFVVICGACSTESTESENIATPGIFARMNVDALSTGSSKVTVELNVGGSNGTNISLSSGERLEASNGNQVKVMNRDTDFLDIDYEIDFDNADTTAPFRVSFFRSTGEVIDGSSVFLPPDFDISSPTTNQSFSIDGQMPITWAPTDPGQFIELVVSTLCTNNTGGSTSSSQTFNLNDDGFENFSLSLVGAATDATIDQTRDCELRFTLERRRTGAIDPGFESGGSFRSRQVRSVDDSSVDDMVLTF